VNAPEAKVVLKGFAMGIRYHGFGGKHFSKSPKSENLYIYYRCLR
jgi:hypothetical protein